MNIDAFMQEAAMQGSILTYRRQTHLPDSAARTKRSLDPNDIFSETKRFRLHEHRHAAPGSVALRRHQQQHRPFALFFQGWDLRDLSIARAPFLDMDDTEPCGDQA